MKYRGVIIDKVQWLNSIDIGKRESSPVRPVFKTGYAPHGVNFPMEMNECKESIDVLINKVMSMMRVSEPEAIKLLNQ
jgi:hypothetical protein